jgi:small nuclear ribonucleoprotein (snRNP)-like protein
MDTNEEPSGVSISPETKTGRIEGCIPCIVVGLNTLENSLKKGEHMKAIAPECKKIKTIIQLKQNYKITGEVVAYDNYNGRISDVINYDKKFVNITGVEVRSADDTIIYKGNFLCLNKDSILFFYTEES